MFRGTGIEGVGRILVPNGLGVNEAGLSSRSGGNQSVVAAAMALVSRAFQVSASCFERAASGGLAMSAAEIMKNHRRIFNRAEMLGFPET